jgi:hypothetical protein
MGTTRICILRHNHAPPPTLSNPDPDLFLRVAAKVDAGKTQSKAPASSGVTNLNTAPFGEQMNWVLGGQDE